MANTYSQIYVHAIFAVQNRMAIIGCEWQDELYRYLTGIAQKHEHKLLAINGMPDHVHLFVSMQPKQAISDLVYHLKRGSSLWINERNLCGGRFSWQEGFGAFTYSKSQIPRVVRYIENQQKHHQKSTFIDEYKDFLNKFAPELDQQYIFKPVDYEPLC